MPTTSVRGAGSGGPSITDVARLAGVAIGTVSNVLNNPAKVTDKTRQRVEAAIQELGFVRNSAARALVSGTTDTIGLVLVDIRNSFFVDIAQGVEAAIGPAGLKVLLANSSVDQARQDAYLELFDEARSAGVVLAPLDGPLDAAHVVQRHGRPIVLVNSPSIDNALCNVVVNEELGGRLAAEHVLRQGARNLVFLGGPMWLRALRDRLRGVEAAVREAGASLRSIDTGGLRLGRGHEVGRQILADGQVDGVLCASDPMAVGVLHAAMELSISVPQDVMVIGYDDNHFAAEGAMPVSTIRQPGHRMGEMATELLLEEIRDPLTHQHRAVALDPELVVRQSSERAAAP